MTPRCPGCGVISRADAEHLDSCPYQGRRALPSAVVFSSSAYRKAHGRAPSGTGDWAFSLDGRGPLWIVGVPFKEARAEALRRAREAGARTVEVLS
jgi:hypothetical protein